MFKKLTRAGSQKLLRYNSSLSKLFVFFLIFNIAIVLFSYFPLDGAGGGSRDCESPFQKDKLTHFMHDATNGGKTKPTAVIIFTEMRSGSSFIGEFFNQHQEVTYLFEPLHSFGKTCDVLTDEKTQILKNLVTCNFSNFSKIHKKVLKKTKQSDDKARCSTKGICFQSRSAFIRRNPALCSQPSDCEKQFYPSELSKACEHTLMPVIKTIRICQIAALMEVLETSDAYVKVIHVVRDPRAIILSRKQLYEIHELPGTYNMSSEVKDLCNRHRNSINEILPMVWSNEATLYRTEGYADLKYKKLQKKNNKTVPLENKKLFDLLTRFNISEQHSTRIRPRAENESKNWLNGKYLLVRYEDVYANPKGSMREMYEFVGLNPSWATNTWVSGHTRMDYADSSPFSTERDNKFQPTKWKKKLKPNAISEITYRCADVLYHYGYL